MTRWFGLRLLTLVTVIFCSNETLGQSNADEAFEAQQYEAAIEAWDKLLDENPDLKDIHYNQGNANYRLGELDEAISAYEQALSVKDKDALADIYYNLGNAWLHKQDVDKAREFYKQTLRLRPGDEDSKANLELLNQMPPPPPKEQNSEQNQDDQSDQEQEEQSQKDQQNEDQGEEEQSEDEQKENEQEQSEDKQEEQEQQNPAQEDEKLDQEDMKNAQQLLDALKDRETENMREQIRLKTSGQDNEKDW